jgi:hypothetical protein
MSGSFFLSISPVNMMTTKYRFIWFMLFIMTGGCSSGEDEATQNQSGTGHVFSGQTQAIEKAGAVEQLIQSGADRQRQTIEDQSYQ